MYALDDMRKIERTQGRMEEKKIRARFAARKCQTQIEFERIMQEMNTEQEHLNHPYLDQIRELRKKRSNLETQKQAINVQLNQINIQRIELEQKQKDVNRLFHDLFLRC